MPSYGSLGAFAGLSFVLVLIPGPSVAFVVSRAVALGRKAALITVAGNAVGIYIPVLLVAAGLGVVVERSVAVFTAVKLFGAAPALVQMGTLGMVFVPVALISDGAWGLVAGTERGWFERSPRRMEQ